MTNPPPPLEYKPNFSPSNYSKGSLYNSGCNEVMYGSVFNSKGILINFSPHFPHMFVAIFFRNYISKSDRYIASLL